MPNPPRRLILANGEKLVGAIEKPMPFGVTELPRSFDDARDLVVTQLSRALETGEALPPSKKYPDDLILCLRLHPDMLAKRYDPESVLTELPELRNVGSRSWHVLTGEGAQSQC